MLSCLPNTAGIATSTFNLVNNVAFEPLVNRGLQERTYLLLLLHIWCGVNHTHISGRVSCGDLMKFVFLKRICNQREKLGTYFGVYVTYTYICLFHVHIHMFVEEYSHNLQYYRAASSVERLAACIAL